MSIEFTLGSSEDFEIIKGLVVPKGSQVKNGLKSIELPTQESSLRAFKLLFGVKKRSRLSADDEDSVQAPVAKELEKGCDEEDEEEEEEDFEEFEDEEEETLEDDDE